MTADGIQRSRFWLEFRIFRDGLDSSRAQQVTLDRAVALGGAEQQTNSSFSRFPELPPELRLKIWDYLIVPRIVQIFCLQEDCDSERHDSHPEPSHSPREPTYEDLYRDHGRPPSSEVGDDHAAWLRNQLRNPKSRPWASRIPVILHINRESRQHGLKHYQLTFSWKVPYVLSGMDMVGSSFPRVHEPAQGDDKDGNNLTQSTSQQQQQRRRQMQTPPTWSEPRVYFNYALDAVYLAGELEPYDSFGFNSPMAYFLRREDCKRVQHVALAFRALHYGETASQQIFGALFHVVDRFSPRYGRVFVTVSPSDEITHMLLGGEKPLIPGFSPTAAAPTEENTAYTSASDDSEEANSSSSNASLNGNNIINNNRRPANVNNEDNIVQKLWRDWYRGSLVFSSLANIKFDLVQDWNLHKCIEEESASASVAASASSRGPGRQPSSASRCGCGGAVKAATTSTGFADEEEDYASIPAGLEALAL